MIKKLSITDFDKMFPIMEDSFPPDERRPYDEQKALFENGYYNVYAEFEADKVKGFIAVWNFTDFLYVEHFAVSKEYRNRGTGAKLISEVVKLYKKTLCLEVEPPEDELTRRRIGFYERNGFFLNEYPYIQPPISAGKNPVPLMIMSSEKALSEENFGKIKKVLYNEVYKCNENDY